jgi:hypothetical protein
MPPALADLIRRLLDREPHRRPATASEVADAMAAHSRTADLRALLGEPRLHAVLDLKWWDAAAGRWRSLSEPGSLPMPTSTRFRIEAHLTRPAYLYLLWIDTQAKLFRMHGWAEGSWQPLASLAPVSSLQLPQDDPERGPQSIPLEGPAGTESVVLLARLTPLDHPLNALWPNLSEGLEGQLGDAVAKLPPDPARGYEFTCRQEEFADSTKGPGKPMPVSDDPLALLQLVLREGVGRHFALVHALSFANRGL